MTLNNWISPIPGNDDAIRAVKLIAETIANAVIEAKQGEQYSAPETEDDDSEESMEEALKKEEEKSSKEDK